MPTLNLMSFFLKIKNNPKIIKNGIKIQNPTNPNDVVIAIERKANGVLSESIVTNAKRMKQMPPIIDIEFLVIFFFSSIYVLIIN